MFSLHNVNLSGFLDNQKRKYEAMTLSLIVTNLSVRNKILFLDEYRDINTSWLLCFNHVSSRMYIPIYIQNEHLNSWVTTLYITRTFSTFANIAPMQKDIAKLPEISYSTSAVKIEWSVIILWINTCTCMYSVYGNTRYIYMHADKLWNGYQYLKIASESDDGL